MTWEEDSIHKKKEMDVTEESIVSKEKEKEKGSRIFKTPDMPHIKEEGKRKDVESTEKENTEQEEKGKERPQYSTGTATGAV